MNFLTLIRHALAELQAAYTRAQEGKEGKEKALLLIASAEVKLEYAKNLLMKHEEQT